MLISKLTLSPTFADWALGESESPVAGIAEVCVFCRESKKMVIGIATRRIITKLIKRIFFPEGMCIIR